MDVILLGRYRVLRPLGQGGRGEVFLCDDLRLGGRQWAVKRMVVGDDDPVARERFRTIFEAEARTLSSLKHPLLPHVSDFFEEDGAWYLVMEHIAGHNLQDYVREHGPLAERDALTHGITLARILEHLHSQQPPLLFRDLKPANCMRTPEGSLKLVDFGLASSRHREGWGPETAQGSVGYSPPEQWSRDEVQDERLDIYAWGATMVYLLTGQHPSPHHPMSALRADGALRAGGGASPAGVSTGTVALIARCLHFEVGKRWPSASHLLAALTEQAAILGMEPPPEPAGSGVHRRPSPTSSPSGELRASRAEIITVLPTAPPRFSRVARYTGGLLLACLLALLWHFYPRQSPEAAQEAPRAESHRRVAGPDLALGKRYYLQGRWAEAIASLDQACTAAPDDSEAAILKENAYALLSHAAVETVPFFVSASGTDAPEYYPHLDGIALAQAEINLARGSGGRKLVIELCDDASSTSETLKKLEHLAADPRIRCVLGPTSSQRLLAAAPVAAANHLTLLSPTASSERIWTSGSYVLTASDGRAPRVAALASYLFKRGCRRCGVVSDSTNRLSRDMASTFVGSIRAAGGSCVELPPFQDTPATIDAICQAIQTTPLDAVFFADYRVPPLAHFAQELRRRDIKAVLSSQTVPFARELIEQGGSAVEGLLLTDFFHPQAATPAMKRFVDAFRGRFGDLVPTYQAANSYDALRVLAQGLTETRTREQLNTWLRASGTSRPPFEGVSGQFALGRRLDARPIWIIEVHNGRFSLMPKT